MKVYQVKNQIVKMLDSHNYNKEQKFLDKYVNIHGYTGNSDKEINTARKVLANYAKEKGVTIDIFAKGSQNSEEISQNVAKNPMENRVLVVVKDLLSGKSSNRIVDVDKNKTYMHDKTIGFYYIEDEEEGVEMTRVFKGQYEDSFLRHLYRNISDMVYRLLPKTK
jgi:hypothetical protein